MNQSKQVNLLRENYEVIKSSGVHFIDKRMRYLIARVFYRKCSTNSARIIFTYES